MTGPGVSDRYVSERTRVRRQPDRGGYERLAVCEVLDAGLVTHVAFISLVLASLVLARRFAGLRQWRWVAYCTITAVGMPAPVAYGMTNLNIVGVAFFAMAIVMTGWNAAIALHLRSNSL